MPVRGLAVPKHVARARALNPSPLPGLAPADNADTTCNDIDAPIPEGMPQPSLFKLFVMPVSLRSITKGGIFLPDETLSNSEWFLSIGRVAAIGKYAFKGKQYRDIDFDPADAPAVGDLLLYDARAPRRFRFKNTNFVVIQDDQFWGRPQTVEGFQFYGIDT
jgi:hypothetical protein